MRFSVFVRLLWRPNYVLASSSSIQETKNDPLGRFLFLGAQDETRTHNPVKEADFKSAAYTNSATWAKLPIKMEVRTRVALVYEVLQTSA